MKLNPKLTGGLAWAGLILILAVPSADLLTKQDAGSAAVITSDLDPDRAANGVDPTRTATVVVKPPAAVTVPTTPDPVDEYLQSGKKLPSYISDAPAEVAATKPAPTVKLVVPETPATAAPAPVDTASIDPTPTVVPPQPYPASKRPQPSVVTTASIEEAPLIIDEDPLIVEDEPLIVDENLVARRDAALARVLEDQPTGDRVEGNMLEEWDSGSLAEYLERRGMLSGGQAQATDYDSDGFFLDEGPNNGNGRRIVRRAPPNEFFLF